MDYLFATPGTVKRLLPPRQSRGISYVCLGGRREPGVEQQHQHRPQDDAFRPDNHHFTKSTVPNIDSNRVLKETHAFYPVLLK
jgi:hypothetical protein